MKLKLPKVDPLLILLVIWLILGTLIQVLDLIKMYQK